MNIKPYIGGLASKKEMRDAHEAIAAAAEQNLTVQRHHFEVSDKKILEFFKRQDEVRQAVFKEAKKLQRRHKAKEARYSNTGGVELRFDADPEPGVPTRQRKWCSGSSTGFYRPHQKNAPELYKEFRSLARIPADSDALPLIHEDIGAFPLYFSGHHTHYATILFIHTAKTAYLSLPYMDYNPAVLDWYEALGSLNLSKLKTTNLDASVMLRKLSKALDRVPEYKMHEAIQKHNAGLKKKKHAAPRVLKATPKRVKKVAKKTAVQRAVDEI